MPLPVNHARPAGHAPERIDPDTVDAARQRQVSPVGRTLPPALVHLGARASDSPASSATVNPMAVMPLTRGFDVVATPGGWPPVRGVRPYSSLHVRAVEIREENRQGSILAATRQVFAVDVQSDDGQFAARDALVIRERGRAPQMAILEEPVDHRYQPLQDEPVRPLTPGIDRALQAVSNARTTLSGADRERYRLFDAMLRTIPDDPRTRYLGATENITFDNVDDVEDGELKVIVVAPGSDRKLGTRGVVNCIACAASAPSWMAPGSTVLALTHYTGVADGRVITPRECLQQLHQQIVASGGDPTRLAIRLAGGERAASVNDGAHQLDEEFEFLALREEFPIVAAHIQASSVDTNASNETIWRRTHDGHGNVISAVLVVGGFFYAHRPLY